METMAVDGLVPSDTSNHRLCDWQPQRTDLPSPLAAYSVGISGLSQFQRFLEDLCHRLSDDDASGRWQRDRGNSTYGALEQHAPPTPGALCSEDVSVFETGSVALSSHQMVYFDIQFTSIMYYLATTNAPHINMCLFRNNSNIRIFENMCSFEYFFVACNILCASANHHVGRDYQINPCPRRSAAC
ncbi:hypothetical protein U14_04215 [Candidatus Moduliflexus flocculans]|uniref:Uncharacterized protein n=1 Tax=Candidatus Moduliflexus flocculans TaxID=1499966 RepID=A0A0S6W3Q9_9BACT|nr:hypothetical protein U14_04215 [Candidatus Moduliflexus flocculans]